MDAEHCKNCEDRTDNDEGKSENREPEMTCCICLEDIQEKDSAKSVPCEHAFHESCIGTWLSYNIRCPMCRSEIILVRRVLSDTLKDATQNGIGASNNNSRDIGMGLGTTSGEIQRIMERMEVLDREYNILSRQLEEESARFQQRLVQIIERHAASL